MTDKTRKIGPWTDKEKTFIAENADKLSFQEIARQIERDPETVSKYIRKTLGLRIKKKGNSSFATLTSGTNIENSFIWKHLKQELNEEELELFLYNWNRIIVQFKEDVFPTEEIQIVDTIKIDILMGRCLKTQKEIIEQINEIQNEINKLVEEKDDIHLMKIDSLEIRKSAKQSIAEKLHSEYTDLLQRKGNLFKELKATRDQRFKKVENARTTFVGWINQIINDNLLRKELGLYIEKNRLAMNAEEIRLSQPFTYSDKTIDLPLLTPETLNQLEDKEE